MHMMRVAVAGASGYAGGEVVRLLLQHPELEVGALTASANVRAAPRLRARAPHAARRPPPRGHHSGGARRTRRRRPRPAARPLRRHRGAARRRGRRRLRGRLPPLRRRRMDRLLRHAVCRELALRPARAPDRSGRNGRTAGERHIAVPGCYPTAVSLALAPGLAAGVVEPDDVTVVAASGTSGAGRSLKPHLLGAEVMGAMSPYGVGGVHRHTPEIEQNLSAAAGGAGSAVSFTPTLAAMPRGILATCTARVRPRARRQPRTCARPGRRPTPTSRSSTCCPRAGGRARAACWAATACTCRSCSTSGSAGWSSCQPSTTSPRAPQVPPCSASTSPSASPRPRACPVAGVAP